MLPLIQDRQSLCDALIGDVLEINAGRAYWASVLSGSIWENGIATDLKTAEKSDKNEIYYPVESLSAVDAVKKYQTETLLTIWPSYDDSYAFDALTEFKGKRVVYVGEGSGGCTADDNFHNLLSEKWNLDEGPLGFLSGLGFTTEFISILASFLIS